MLFNFKTDTLLLRFAALWPSHRPLENLALGLTTRIFPEFVTIAEAGIVEPPRRKPSIPVTDEVPDSWLTFTLPVLTISTCVLPRAAPAVTKAPD